MIRIKKLNGSLLILSVAIAFVTGIIIGSYIPKIEAVLDARAEKELIAQKQKELATERFLDKPGFSVKIPIGWAEVPAMKSTVATVAFADDNPTNEILKNLNFKPYYAITLEPLNGMTIASYSKYMRAELKKIIPSLKFTNENTEKIGGMDAKIMEGEMIQNDQKFKQLIAIIKGNDDDVWTIASNTSEATWETLKNTFYDVVRSFRVKTIPKDNQAPPDDKK